MADAAKKHSEAAEVCRDASEFAHEAAIAFQEEARQNRLHEKHFTKEADTAYREAKHNSKLQQSFPKCQDKHLTLACDCTTFKGCQTARKNAMNAPQALPRDAEHRQAELQRCRHLHEAHDRDRIASIHGADRNLRVCQARFCREKSSELSAFASHHERIDDMYKAQTHGGTSDKHKEMLSHSVHDAEEVIKTASQIKMNIQARIELDLPHLTVPKRDVPRHDGHAPHHH
jgi:hypothetical protein